MEDRSGFIGSSDAAAIVGLSRWKTPLQVWTEKTGIIQPKEQEETLPQLVGKELEDLVCRLFTKKTGLEVRRVDINKTHPKYPFLKAQIDREVVGENSSVEAKTASGRKKKEWSGEDIPIEYIVQATHQILVGGYDKVYVPCLIGGNEEFVIQTVEKNKQAQADLLKKELSFWNDFVVPKIMPSVTSDDKDILLQLYPEAVRPEPIDLGDKGARLVEARNSYYQDLIQLEKQKDQVENEIRAMLKDYEAGVAGKYICTWKNQTSERCDVKRFREEAPELFERYVKISESRRLTIKEMKPNGKRK